eukprot:scpid46919/ scgid35108/ 
MPLWLLDWTNTFWEDIKMLSRNLSLLLLFCSWMACVSMVEAIENDGEWRYYFSSGSRHLFAVQADLTKKTTPHAAATACADKGYSLLHKLALQHEWRVFQKFGLFHNDDHTVLFHGHQMAHKEGNEVVVKHVDASREFLKLCVIRCVHGYFLENQCLCRSGYTGASCETLLQETACLAKTTPQLCPLTNCKNDEKDPYNVYHCEKGFMKAYRVHHARKRNDPRTTILRPTKSTWSSPSDPELYFTREQGKRLCAKSATEVYDYQLLTVARFNRLYHSGSDFRSVLQNAGMLGPGDQDTYLLSDGVARVQRREVLTAAGAPHDLTAIGARYRAACFRVDCGGIGCFCEDDRFKGTNCDQLIKKRDNGHLKYSFSGVPDLGGQLVVFGSEHHFHHNQAERMCRDANAQLADAELMKTKWGAVILNKLQKVNHRRVYSSESHYWLQGGETIQPSRATQIQDGSRQARARLLCIRFCMNGHAVNRGTWRFCVCRKGFTGKQCRIRVCVHGTPNSKGGCSCLPYFKEPGCAERTSLVIRHTYSFAHIRHQYYVFKDTRKTNGEAVAFCKKYKMVLPRPYLQPVVRGITLLYKVDLTWLFPSPHPRTSDGEHRHAHERRGVICVAGGFYECKKYNVVLHYMDNGRRNFEQANYACQHHRMHLVSLNGQTCLPEFMRQMGIRGEYSMWLQNKLSMQSRKPRRSHDYNITPPYMKMKYLICEVVMA